MDGYNGGVNDSAADAGDWRDLVFMCADTGAVVAVSYPAEKRAALVRAVVFLASGDTLWFDGAHDGGTRATLTAPDGGFAGRHALRLSAQARLLTGPGYLASGEIAAGPRVPVGLELDLEPASRQLALGSATPPPGQVALVKCAGSLAVGSVVRRVVGAAWASAGPDGGPGGRADSRARAVFQDGSALYVATGAGQVADAGPVAALVHNSGIRAAGVRDFRVRGGERGQPGRGLSWAGDGRSPAGARAEIRDPRQQLIVTRPDPAGSGWLSWGCAPFVFVRSGVTGLGLVERRTRLATAVTAAEPAAELPDPFLPIPPRYCIPTGWLS